MCFYFQHNRLILKNKISCIYTENNTLKFIYISVPNKYDTCPCWFTYSGC